MVEFAYNNAKNSCIGYLPFKLNFGYHSCISYKKDINIHFKFKVANELTKKL